MSETGYLLQKYTLAYLPLDKTILTLYYYQKSPKSAPEHHKTYELLPEKFQFFTKDHYSLYLANQ
jgi:hypothetical protein